MNTKTAYRAALIASVAFTTLPAVAHAQAAPSASEDEGTIVVTGQRQPYIGTTPLKDMPQNIQAISADTLKIVAATKLSDALDMVSGVAQLNNFGGLWDGYAVRGFAGDSNNVPTGMLVNGFNGGRGFSGPRDASSVETIQVLKGPTSAMFGRGEPGGTVNVVTKKPLFKEYGYLTVQGGSWNQYRVEADYTHPLSDKFSFRINGAYEQGDSYRDTVHYSKIFLTPSILWNITDNTSLAYELEFSHQKIPFDRGIPIYFGPNGYDFDRLPASRYLGEPGDGPTRADVLGHQFTLQHQFTDKWTFLGGIGFRQTDLKGVGEYPEFAAARQPFLNTTGALIQGVPAAGTIVARQRRYLNYHSSDLTFRGEINGEFALGSLVNHLVFGADYNRFELDQLQTRFRPGAYNAGSTLQSINAINALAPVYGAYPQPDYSAAIVYNRDETDYSWGTYFSDQIDLTPWLKVRAGGRYDEFRQHFIRRDKNTFTYQKVTKFSPQVGLVIEPNRSISLYATYGKGFRPNNGSDVNGNTFQPEISKAYEVGLKYVSPDQRIHATIALYQMDKTNILTSDPNPANSGFVIAAGSARSKGIEVDFDARLPMDFHLIANYAYTDAYSLSTVLDPDFAKPILPGDPLINVPKNSGNVLLTKDFRLGGDRKLTIGGGVRYIDRRLGETATNYFLPSATLVKLLASVDVTDHIRINANVDNLLNKRWFANSYAALWTFPGAPRSFKVSATYKF